MESSEINEASGLIVSKKNDGILYTHNDSGDKGRIFAVTVEGKLVCKSKLLLQF